MTNNPDDVADNHSAKPMTDNNTSRDDARTSDEALPDDETMVEVPLDTYTELREQRSQLYGEDWVDVARRGDQTVRARPVERQDGREEGELIESDKWLIEDVNGETYTVDEDTYNEHYDSVVTRRFRIDLSVEPEDIEEEFIIEGNECFVDVTAYINVVNQTVIKMYVEQAVNVDEDWTGDALPIEWLLDNDDIIELEADDK